MISADTSRGANTDTKASTFRRRSADIDFQNSVHCITKRLSEQIPHLNLGILHIGSNIQVNTHSYVPALQYDKMDLSRYAYDLCLSCPDNVEICSFCLRE